MVQLVYVSSAVKPFSEEQLFQLLRKARKTNAELGISGMLLYKKGEFMQALEGEELVVDTLAHRISRDPRHRDIRVLLNGHIHRREFPDWSMGFANLDQNRGQHDGFNTFLDSPLRSHKFTGDPALCRELLLMFKTKLHTLVNRS